ncbi:MAG: hypothetical protein EA344_06770 [Alkalicoccus sp.]|nr:MAG: hypothetical protein EA344_06770 [Alkalicoccus sp.]
MLVFKKLFPDKFFHKALLAAGTDRKYDLPAVDFCKSGYDYLSAAGDPLSTRSFNRDIYAASLHHNR